MNRLKGFEMPEGLRRSALYLPASNLKAIEKARFLPCDVVILDLEDAVAPEAKATARDQACAAVREGGFGPRELVVRINGLDTEWGRGDIDAFAASRPAAILLPKVNAAEDISACEKLLPEGVALWAMIETARSIFRLDEIAATATTGRLACLVMGTNDLAREMGAVPGIARTPFLGMLGLAVAAARAYGIAILDGVFNALEDEAGLAAQCRQAVEFGFDGKTLIHPNQIGPCNAAFTPAPEAVAWAERILAAFEAPENAGKGALRVDGSMVERLHLLQARRTLAMAAGANSV
jgi:citrate lyase subunit beta/citryl-CoA lyase